MVQWVHQRTIKYFPRGEQGTIKNLLPPPRGEQGTKTYFPLPVVSKGQQT